MRSTLYITVLACLAMLSLQCAGVYKSVAEANKKRCADQCKGNTNTSICTNMCCSHGPPCTTDPDCPYKRRLVQESMSKERRLALTKDFNHARRMGFKFPKQMCKPAHEAGVFILDTAVMCAIEAIIPGAGNIAKAIRVGKKVADKLGVMGKINALKTKAEKFVISKFLGIFGCKVRRRMGFFKSIAKHVKKAAGKVVKKVGKAAKGAAKAAGGAVKFVVKNAGAIAKVVCPVVKPMCKPGCSAAVTAFRAAGAAAAATVHIPIGCLANAVENGCNKMCKVICGRRRLGISKL